jgi:hypothetical protein
MRILVATMGLTVAMLQASPAICQEPQSPPLPLKRQMVICMNKSMAADRTLSFNAAQKDCKDRLLTQNASGIGKRTLAANATDSPALKNP